MPVELVFTWLSATWLNTVVPFYIFPFNQSS